MHPDDADARGIADGDIIRLFNARGACLAAVRVTDGIRPAWSSCRPAPGTTRRTPRTTSRSASTAIPNVLTRDVGTSASRRAAPASSRPLRSNASPAIYRLYRPTIHRPADVPGGRVDALARSYVHDESPRQRKSVSDANRLLLALQQAPELVRD